MRLIPLALAAAAAVLSQAHAQADNGWLNLTVIHTNDVHARVDPINDLGAACTAQDISGGRCYGGTARHKTLIQQLRKGKQHSLLLDGGDEVNHPSRTHHAPDCLLGKKKVNTHQSFSTIPFALLLSHQYIVPSTWYTRCIFLDGMAFAVVVQDVVRNSN